MRKLSRLFVILTSVTAVVLYLNLYHRLVRLETRKALEFEMASSAKFSTLSIQLTRNTSTISVSTSNSFILAGHLRHNNYLAIGVPSTYRKNTSYLLTTLTSLIGNMNGADHDVTIVVFLSDFNTSRKYYQLSLLNKTFRKWIDAGSLLVIHAPRTFYPHFSTHYRTYDDEPERVLWRQKQCYDYIYLWKFCRNISTYYMQLEDDVVTVPGYISAIKNYVNENRKNNWWSLEFSSMGYIGKFYRSNTLQDLSAFAQILYREHPIDFIFSMFNELKMQKQRFMHIPSLFQHLGNQSTLASKVVQWSDKYFINYTKIYKGDNPPAKIECTMIGYGSYPPSAAYGDGFFWAKNPKRSQMMKINFETPQNVSRVVIASGSVGHRLDIIGQGILEVFKTTDDKTIQIETNRTFVSEIRGSLLDVSLKHINDTISSIQITLTKDQTNWIIFREVAVFLKNKR